MRVQIRVDGASTEDVRSLMVALHRVGHTGELTVGCDGPYKWIATTPKVQAVDFTRIVREWDR